ncbi:MAG: truC [Chlorobi bacterium]|nr:truC [Chlorobiota bacterium]
MLRILYHNDHIVAIDKPDGLLVHRSAEAPDRTTCMTLLRDQLGQLVYPAHRIDRGTSGVLLFSLNPATARLLAERFSGREVEKQYLTLVRGWSPDDGEIDYPLAEEPGMTAVEAVTGFRTLARCELPIPIGNFQTARYSLVLAEPVTGRRHQIRRHMAHLRHPIVGDTVHGEGRHNRLFRENFGVHRMILHAWRLSLPHPVPGEPLAITAPLPQELEILFSKLGWEDVVPA